MILSLKDVIVEDRLRRDMGDIEELARCIANDGLIQPPVVEQREDGKFYLVAGGRRYAALTLLASNENKEEAEFFAQVDFTVLNDLSPSQRKKLELVENIYRENMTWQEKALGIADYHKLSKKEARKEGEAWTQEQTGKLLNMSQANVSIALSVADELRNPESPLWKCDSLQSAMQFQTKQRLDEANKELMKRLAARREATQPIVRVASNTPITTDVVAQVNQVADKAAPKITKDEILSFYYQGDCLDILPTLAKSHTINHIVCDPPYGIDMDYLGGEDASRNALVSRTANEHVVSANLDLLPKFLRVAYEVIAEDGFLCMWYDLDHHEKIRKWAEQVGWKVCRWPVVWCKTSPCMNNAAQYNVTKATEVCYIMRRSEKSMIKVKQPKNYVLAGTASTATHPFCKPHEVWKYLLDMVSLEGQTIVDPFAGEGSSLASMFKMKRLPIGIEINEAHVGNGLSFIESELNDPFNALLSNGNSLLV